MKLNLASTDVSLIASAALALSALSTQAQGVLVSGELTDVAAGGGVFDYTLTLQNTGTEAVESLWVGWIPGSFNVDSPSNPGNLQAWSSAVDGSSLQYLGTPATAIPAGGTGVFTFASTTTPAQFANQTGMAGESTAYGVNAVHGQLSFSLSPPDTETFGLSVVPEPSVIGLFAIGSLSFARAFRRKSASTASPRL